MSRYKPPGRASWLTTVQSHLPGSADLAQRIAAAPRGGLNLADLDHGDDQQLRDLVANRLAIVYADGGIDRYSPQYISSRNEEVKHDLDQTV